MTRRRLIRWAFWLAVAWILYRYADAMYADCMARIGDRVECSVH